MSWRGRAFDLVFRLCGYGLSWRILIRNTLVAFALLGLLSAFLGYRWGLIKPTQESKASYPRLNIFIYAADAFIPLVNFHQEDYWLPQKPQGNDLTPKDSRWRNRILGYCLPIVFMLCTVFGYESGMSFENPRHDFLKGVGLYRIQVRAC